MRSQARESVFKYVFSRLFNPTDEGLFPVLCSDLNEDDKNFATDLLCAVDKKFNEYIGIIDGLALNYRADRVLNADKCALIIGMAELDGFPNTDLPVIVDEAVKLAAKFSTEKSSDFVNGILASYAKERK